MLTERLECVCLSPGHNVRFQVDTQTGEISIDVALDKYLKFWHRVKLAFAYVFNLDNYDRYQPYDCCILKIEDYDRIREMLAISEKADNVHGDHL
jgi:hypothetical protein